MKVILSKNKESIKDFAKYNFQTMVLLFKENWKFVFDLLSSNEEILNQYFNKVELEIYTSEESSVKPMSFLRNLY